MCQRGHGRRQHRHELPRERADPVLVLAAALALSRDRRGALAAVERLTEGEEPRCTIGTAVTRRVYPWPRRTIIPWSSAVRSAGSRSAARRRPATLPGRSRVTGGSGAGASPSAVVWPGMRSATAVRIALRLTPWSRARVAMEQRLAPLRAPLGHRRVLDAELHGQVLDHWPRHCEWVLQEQADVPHRAHLEREAEPVMLRPPQGDQVPVHVVQEVKPLQLGPRRLLGERPVRFGLLIAQKFHRHEPDRSQPRTEPGGVSPNPSGEVDHCAGRP